MVLLQDIKEEDSEVVADAENTACATPPSDVALDEDATVDEEKIAIDETEIEHNDVEIDYDSDICGDVDFASGHQDLKSAQADLQLYTGSQEVLLPPLPEDNTDLTSPATPMAPAQQLLQPGTDHSQISLESAVTGDRGSQTTAAAAAAAASSSLRSSSAHSVTSPVSRAPSVVRRALSGSPLASAASSPNVLPGTLTSTSDALHSDPSEPFDLATAFEMRDDTQLKSAFDLSKALQIPQSSVPAASPISPVNISLINSGSNSSTINTTAATTITSTNSSATSATAPHSPHITPPKLSFKKKFSSSVLPVTSPTVAPASAENGSGLNSISDFPLHHLQRYGSLRSRALTSDLPRMNSKVDIDSHQGLGIENVNSESALAPHTDKILLRKFSVGSSGSSSRSYQEIDESAMFKPPPSFNSDANSLASLHDLKSPRSSLNLSEASNINNKKIPLIKRASSAIWRKASLTRAPSSPKASDPSSATSYQELRHTSSFATIPYNSQDVDRDMNPNTDKAVTTARAFPKNSLTRLKKSYGSSRSVSSPDHLHQVTSLPTPPGGSNFCRTPDTQSFGAKFKNGLTRIMSGSTADKSPGYPESHSNTTQVNTRFSFGESRTPDSGIMSSPLNRITTLNRSSSTGKTNGVLQPSKQASLAMKPSTNDGTQTAFGIEQFGKKGEVIKKTVSSSTGSANTARNESVFSRNSDESLEQCSDNDELTVDISELTKTLPTITITEKLGARSVTPIQTQSNLLLDLIYKDGAVNKHLASNNNNKSTKAPPKITLKDYIDVLIKQQRVEDERFAVLEYKFAQNGWCSRDDLNNLQQKRIIINRKWAERISYYQGRLEA
ncbi:LAME_0F08724g1_1 [Lachancea meyersii CBS 8951]|uniref:LAME_0F08724g1_1 n=1 Tax=Lachancea meyersii CBS 8951 TaxID=1266667 RepID=A0A1G4JUS1_9SACH|nr:LAME_0F08724g1_1 [Lachancea meyersii CBS 8951]